MQLKDGRKFVTKDIKADPKTDLAIVRIQAKARCLTWSWATASSMEIGDRVLAVGAPFGLTGSVTAGIISAKGRSLNMNMYEDFLQTDAAINPGNSGGPLVNLEGKVIGINAAIKSRSGGLQGIGLAISSNLVKHVETSLVKYGTVHRGYLGVGIDEVDNETLATHLGVKTGHGVIVTQVFANGPAAKAGVKEGDVITALGGKPVQDMRSLQWAVAELPKGDPLKLSVIHDGKPETLSVVIAEQPPTFGTTQAPRPVCRRPSKRRFPRQDRRRSYRPDAKTGRGAGLQGYDQGRSADERGPSRSGGVGRPRSWNARDQGGASAGDERGCAQSEIGQGVLG